GGEDRKVRLHPLGAARREERDPVALLSSEGDQTQSELANDVTDLAPGDGLPLRPLLERLSRAAGAPLHAVPEQPRQRVGSHTLPLTQRSQRVRRTARL